MLQLEAPIIVDGRRSTADIVRVRGTSSSSGVGPEQSAKGLREKHSYGDEATFPSFETPGAIDVTAAPYFAKGDGASDDAAAINAALQAAAAARTRARTTQQQAVVFLPKGVYRLSATVLVPQGVALVGTSHRLVLLVPTRDRSARLNSSEPLIRMLGPSDSAFTAGEIIPGSTLAHMMLGTMQHQRNVVAWCETVRGLSPCARKWEKRSF
jgi:pectin methylesterase-like acyl-CoA thioesterase